MNEQEIYQVGNNKKVILWCTANQISRCTFYVLWSVFDLKCTVHLQISCIPLDDSGWKSNTVSFPVYVKIWIFFSFCVKFRYRWQEFWHRITLISIPLLQVFEIVLLLSLVGMLAETDFLDGWLLGFCIAATAQLTWVFVLLL